MKPRLCLATALALAGACAFAQQQPAPVSGGTLPGVNVKSAGKESVEKSYRRMVRGMDLFERERARLSPQGQLRFKVLPRKPGVNLDRLDLYVLGKTVEQPVDVAPDRTFTLPRLPKALDENALVSPDRRALSMTWRAEVRTPGLPPDTRRLGDMRLECHVGMEAGLVSNSPNFFTQIFSAISDTPAYCEEAGNRYLFFADRPVFGVTLVSGGRRERLPMNRLYAAALDEPSLKNELPYCDCEVLLDRAHYLPLADRSWPDDTLVVYDYMETPDAAARQ
ncbi:hypothetical protein [Ramlibacter humi]|uniref:hypothetical protein n=1 Tax=Ramlibacter humi TaxID=2530451 RepID=UPI001EF04C2B|nr:hypothetical protein [Ramlibacter humi]